MSQEDARSIQTSLIKPNMTYEPHDPLHVLWTEGRSMSGKCSGILSPPSTSGTTVRKQVEPSRYTETYVADWRDPKTPVCTFDPCPTLPVN